MKKIIILALTSMLSLNLLAADQLVSAADQKWLGAIEKMVASGQREISTPSESRSQLLMEWAKKNGYTTQLTKTESAFRIGLSKSIAKNG